MKVAIKMEKERRCPRSGRHPRKGRLGRGFTIDETGMVWAGTEVHWWPRPELTRVPRQQECVSQSTGKWGL